MLLEELRRFAADWLRASENVPGCAEAVLPLMISSDEPVEDIIAALSVEERIIYNAHGIMIIPEACRYQG